MTRQEACERLGVAIYASKSEIKAAFKQKSKEFHPDNNNAPGAVECYRSIQEAYEALRSMPDVVLVGGDNMTRVNPESVKRGRSSNITEKRIMREQMEKRDEIKRRQKKEKEEQAKKELFERRKELEYRKAMKDINLVLLAEQIKQTMHEDRIQKAREKKLFEAFEKRKENLGEENA